MAEGWHYVTTTPLAGTATRIGPANCFVGPVVIANLTASTAWLQLFDAAATADITPGTTKPKVAIAVAASLSKEVDLCGLTFLLGCWAITATAAEGATGANTNTMIGVG